MKVLLLAAALLLGAAVDATETTAQAQALSIGKFYDRVEPNNPWATQPHLDKISLLVDTWAYRYRIGQHATWILALISIESNFDPTTKGRDGEEGLGQATPGSQKHYGSILRTAGHKGTIKDPEWQVALCVAEFAAALKASDGDPGEAARRYNGAGPRAQAHAEKVQKRHVEIFGDALNPTGNHANNGNKQLNPH